MKRLVRKTGDKKITGLCAGIADYLEMDPTVVRIVAVAAALVTGVFPLVIVYLIASAIAPKDEIQPSG